MAFWKFTGTIAEYFPALGLTAQPGFVYDLGSSAPPADPLPKDGQAYPLPLTKWVSASGPATDFSLQGQTAVTSLTARGRGGSGLTGVYAPGDWGVNWRSKLAGASISLVRVGILGDSVSYGYYTSNPRTKSYAALLAADLQAQYGDGGSGFTGAWNTPVILNAQVSGGAATQYLSAGNVGWASTGTWAAAAAWGPGATHVTTLTAGSSITISNLRGTSLKIFTVGGAGTAAPYTWAINGGSTTQVNDTTGANPQVQAQVVTAPTGTYSLTITYAGSGSNTLFFVGVEATNPTGVVVCNYSKPGAASSDFPVTYNIVNPGLWSGGSSNPCDLFVWAMGINDSNLSTSTGITLTGTASSGSTTLAVSAYLAPGDYKIDSEVVHVRSCNGLTATLQLKTAAAHNSGATVNVATTGVADWVRNTRAQFKDVRDGSTVDSTTRTGTTDLLILMPHIGQFDGLDQYTSLAKEARALAEEWGAALVNLHAVGRNSWNGWNALGYWGDPTTASGLAGTDQVHLSDAGATAVAAVLKPLLLS